MHQTSGPFWLALTPSHYFRNSQCTNIPNCLREPRSHIVTLCTRIWLLGESWTALAPISYLHAVLLWPLYHIFTLDCSCPYIISSRWTALAPISHVHCGLLWPLYHMFTLDCSGPYITSLHWTVLAPTWHLYTGLFWPLHDIFTDDQTYHCLPFVPIWLCDFNTFFATVSSKLASTINIPRNKCVHNYLR